MQKFFLIFVFWCCTFLPSLPSFLAPLTKSLQTNCANLLPTEMKSRSLAQSFLCGTKISDPNTKEIFKQTSLLHLMVVSGSHLQILCFFILLPWPKKCQDWTVFKIGIFSILSFYCLVTGFQAPLVRALTTRGLESFNEKFKLHWGSNKVFLVSGLLVLAVIPEWISSLSFYLSWLASLGFLLTPLIRSEKSFPLFSSFLTCFFIQTLMSVFFWNFSVLGWIANAILAPVIGFCLLPASALPILSSSFVTVTDWAWDVILASLAWLAQFSDSAGISFIKLTTVKWILLWAFLAFVHSAFEALQKQRYQNQNV